MPDIDLRNELLDLFAEGREPNQKLQLMIRRLLLFFRGRGHSDAEDLVQQTFVLALRRLRRSQQITARDVGNYLFGIAHTVSADVLRAKATETLDESSLVDERAQTRLESELLIAELAALEPAEVSFLVDYVTKDRSRLARQLGVTEGALRVRAFRTRERLRDLLRTRTTLRGDRLTTREEIRQDPVAGDTVVFTGVASLGHTLESPPVSLLEFYSRHRNSIEIMTRPAALFAMAFLPRGISLKVDEFADRLGWSAATVAHVCDQLHELNMIERDDNRTWIRISTGGLTVLSLLAQLPKGESAD